MASEALAPYSCIAVIELIRAFSSNASFANIKSFYLYLRNRVISRFISIGMVGICIGLFEPYAIFKSGLLGIGLL